MKRTSLTLSILSGTAAFLAFATFAAAAPTSKNQAIFQTPDEAVAALMGALALNNPERVLPILGRDAEDLVQSGDSVADAQTRRKVTRLYSEKSSIEPRNDGRVALLLGKVEWPFPIPLVKQGSGWKFDTQEGREEILNRAIGRNELSAINFCHEFITAQKEYATLKDTEGEYAKQFMSSPGTHDGLYWPRKRGETQSPLGPLVALAYAEGYRNGTEEGPRPFHGYLFKILTAQGESAEGGAKNYIGAENKMTGGFALVAYPVNWGVTGIMSFLVNQNGVVYEKNLGPDGEEIAAELSAFNPDEGWSPVKD